jgi:hypothetical protein
MIFCQYDLFLGIGAAYGRTIAVSTRGVNLSGTDALNPGYFMGMLLVRSTQYLTFVWPGGAHQPFIVHTGNHVLELPIAIPIAHLRIKCLNARCYDDRGYFYFYLLRRLFEIDGLILTDSFADTTFLLFKVKTAFIYISDKGNGLSEIDMDGFILRYFLIKLIRIFDRTVFNTGRTTRAFVLLNISGLSIQGYLEVPCFSFYTVNFSIGQDLYIGMPADLDQFGREYSDGAVIGGKGLVKLGHMAANGRCLVDQVNLKTSSGKIERGLNTADPSTDNHHISKITACESITDAVRKTFTNLVFNYFERFFHFPCPLWSFVSLGQ